MNQIQRLFRLFTVDRQCKSKRNSFDSFGKETRGPMDRHSLPNLRLFCTFHANNDKRKHFTRITST